MLQVQDTASFVFTYLLVLIGVPLYGTVLGLFANAATERAERIKMQNKLQAKVRKDEFQYATKLMESQSGGGGSMTKGINSIAYLEMELLRLGRVDRDLLKQIKERFIYLDINGSKTITLLEMQAGMAFHVTLSMQRHAII